MATKMTQKLAKIDEVACQEFDFVIIGGGTAGSVLAGRLTENPNLRVAVLEAGAAHFNDPIVTEPTGWMRSIMDPKYDWKFMTTPQPGFGGEPAIFPRGKGLGGTSLINWMIWNMPQKEEMDSIGKVGNEGWSWEYFHRYAKRVQHLYPPAEDDRFEFKNLYSSDSVGHNGPVALTFGRDSCGADADWQKSLANNGIAAISTSLDGNVVGTYKSVSNIDPVTRTRVDAATAYIVPALDRPNLKVLTDAYANRIVTSKRGDSVVAEAVEFEYDGKLYQVAAKEVVVSAGVAKSPQVLELSGIGDRKILESLGIPVQLDLPAVGTNVSEHITMGATRWKMAEDKNIVTSGMLEDKAFAEKLRTGMGLDNPLELTVNGVSFIPVQLSSERAAELVQKQRERIAKDSNSYPPGLKEQHEAQLELFANPNVPDFEILFFPFTFPLPSPEPDKPYLGIYATLGRPFTRGTVHVQSIDPKASPAIDPQYYSEEIDLDLMVDAFKFIRKVSQTEPFKSLVHSEQLPGPGVATDEQLYEYVRTHTYSTFHTIGSNSMLPRDKGGVVDTKFKVYGTENIRVVDLSVLPMHTAVHPQAVVFTIGEIAADVIKTQYQ